ncbi:hypothetical protein PIB30_095138, partial [Stylosanthes scabra]|nr:hypothetical protein [Stylosanthes scabra]
ADYKAAWSYSTNGTFTIKSIVNVMLAEELGYAQPKQVFENVWKGTVLPRVELMAKALDMGRISWVRPEELTIFFEEWCSMERMKCGKRRLINIWFAIVRTVWRARNEKIFQKRVVRTEDARLKS